MSDDPLSASSQPLVVSSSSSQSPPAAPPPGLGNVETTKATVTNNGSIVEQATKSTPENSLPPATQASSLFVFGPQNESSSSLLASGDDDWVPPVLLQQDVPPNHATITIIDESVESSKVVEQAMMKQEYASQQEGFLADQLEPVDDGWSEEATEGSRQRVQHSATVTPQPPTTATAPVMIVSNGQSRNDTTDQRQESRTTTTTAANETINFSVGTKYWDPSSAKQSASTRRSFLHRQKQMQAAAPPLLEFANKAAAEAVGAKSRVEQPQVPQQGALQHDSTTATATRTEGGESPREQSRTTNSQSQSQSAHPFDDRSLRNVIVFLSRLYDRTVKNDGVWLSTSKKLSKAYSDLMGTSFYHENGSDDLLGTLERLKYLQVDKLTRSRITWRKRHIEDMVATAPPNIRSSTTGTGRQQVRHQGSNVSSDSGSNRQVAINSTSTTTTSSGTRKSALSTGDSWTLADGATRCFFVDTHPRLNEIMASDAYLRAHIHSGLDGANNKNRYAFVAIDAEGVPESLELIQIATPIAVYVLDGQKLGQDVVCNALRPLLESAQIIKVLHDSHQDAVAFQRHGGISLAAASSPSVLDSQLVGDYLFGEYCIGFNALLTKLEVPVHPSKRIVHARMNMQDDYWTRRPLPKTDIEYAALDVACLTRAMQKMQELLSSLVFDKLLTASVSRVQRSIESGGLRTLCFDTNDGKYSRNSAELIQVIRPDDGFFGKPLVVQSEVEDVLNVLPDAFRAKLGPREPCESEDDSKLEGLDEEPLLFVGLISDTRPPPSPQSRPVPPLTLQEGQPPIDLSSLTDIALDIGRRPQCWIKGKRMFLSDDVNMLVTQEDIWYILDCLGEIGSDNRAGLNGKLHRFSVIRARGPNVAGITIRLGRSITGNADLLMDYLLGSEKSILFLGEPGSGKTTVVREATRILAEESNVLVVDTSNEIGGDGLCPHHCIGLARRMMVPSLDEQSAVMVECVQNHTPSCMVIDEIGRPREVLAARTVKQRGVRIIASAHGDLRKLVKNKELRGLIGGVEQVVMGDTMAREEAKRKEQTLQRDGINGNVRTSKTKVQRASEPTFDVIVEVRRGAFHEWRVVPNVAAAVDEILDGREYKAELRSRDPETGQMFLDFRRN